MLMYCHVVCIPKLATQVSSDPFKARLHTAQQEDTVTKQVFTALQTSSQKPQGRSCSGVTKPGSTRAWARESILKCF